MTVLEEIMRYFGVYPMVFLSRDPLDSLTISNAHAGPYGLKVGTHFWWTIGLILAAVYFQFVYRSFPGLAAVAVGELPGQERLDKVARRGRIRDHFTAAVEDLLPSSVVAWLTRKLRSSMPATRIV